MATQTLYAHAVVPKTSAEVPRLRLAREKRTAIRRATGALQGGQGTEAAVYLVTLNTDRGHVTHRIESVECRLRRGRGSHVHFLGSEL